MPEPNYDFQANLIFRFTGLSDGQAKNLKIQIPSVRFGEHFKTKKITGLIDLENPNILIDIKKFIDEYNIKADAYDVFVSIFSENDTEIWNLPKIVNEAIKATDCQIVFSFTSIT